MNKEDRLRYLADVFIIWDEIIKLKRKHKNMIPKKELIENVMGISVGFYEKTTSKVYIKKKKEIEGILSQMKQIGQIYYPERGFIGVV